MSEATGRCGCGIWMWSNVGGGVWTDAVGREKVRMEYCWQCGHQLLAEGRTLAPATEEERADAKRLATVRERAWGMCNEAYRVADEIKDLVRGTQAEDRLRTIASVWGQVVTLCDGGHIPELTYKPKPDTATVTTNPDDGYEVWNFATEQWEQPEGGCNDD